MGRNNKNLKYQFMQRLDSLSYIGTSKHDMQIINYSLGNGYKSDFIHSVRTLELYKDEAARFNSWLKENNLFYKKIDDIPRSIVGDYIKSRNFLSAWTSHISLAAMNKLFGYGFTTKELNLKQRRIQDIRNNRGFSSSRLSSQEKFKIPINFIRASGIRRSSVPKISYNNFIFNNGILESIRTIEKGGKTNFYYVLPDYRFELTSYINSFYSSHSFETPLFADFDPYRHVNCHWFRNEYSCALYSQLKFEFDSNMPYYKDSDYLNYAIKSSKVSYNFKKYGDFYKGYDTMVLSLLSQSLGHYRLDVCVNHYLRF